MTDKELHREDPASGERREDIENEVELTRVEREALARLPREKEPSALLEGRVVRALREQGVLHGDQRIGNGREPAGGKVPVWAAAAAGLIFSIASGLVGHQLGARSATDAFLAVRDQDAALHVQEVGSAYVRSLAALETLLDGAEDDPTLGRGREVATTTLHAAARVMARLDPADPLSPALIQLLDERLFGSESGSASVRRTFSF